MCARYPRTQDIQTLADFFAAPLPGQLDLFQPSYNVAPTDKTVAVTFSPRLRERKFVRLRWGLIPSWAKDRKSLKPLINARLESLDQKPAFRESFKSRRCLIPASGFFEWKSIGKQKQPFFITRADDRPVALAGLWDQWQDNTDMIYSCVIITTADLTGNDLFHGRTPAIVQPENFSEWLHPEISDSNRLSALCESFTTKDVKYWPISPAIGNPRNNYPELLNPMERKI